MSEEAMEGEVLHTLILCADQLSPFAPGYAGRNWAKTPAIDALAASGTVFSDAICVSPICVPSRASMATGMYTHELGTWDNGHAYAGTEAPSWGTFLQEAGQSVTTIGKLHYRDDGPQTGFPNQIIPIHVEEGIGDTFSLLRENLPSRPELREMVAGARSGDSGYTKYDHDITQATRQWLQEHADDAAPWTLFVSHVSPHHPLVAPEEFMAMYPLDLIPLPIQDSLAERPMHPALERLRRYYGYDTEFTENETRKARAVYFALVSYLDHQIATILETLRETGLEKKTRIIFTSDHGDNIGDHALWWKNCMYQGSVGVPLILAGPGLKAGARCDTPVSLLDLAPTILAFAGVPIPEQMHGTNLAQIAANAYDPDRLVFAEYHATGSSNGMFMVADAHYKYVEYVGEDPQLFDRQADPLELEDLAGSASHAGVLAEYAARLRTICNPEEVDRNAKATQQATVERLGGAEAVRAAGFRTHVPPPGHEDD